MAPWIHMNAETLVHSPIHLPLLTNSCITTFNRCPREYQHAYVHLRRPRTKAPALRFGSYFDAALGAWWKADTDRLEAAVAALDASAEEVDAFDRAKAVALLAGYTARWGDEPYQTLAVQKRFNIDGIAGAIDAIAGHKVTGYIFNVEHKTTSEDISPGGEYIRHVSSLDPQVSTYNIASRSMGFNPRYTLYDVIRKPLFAPLKATPPEERKYTKPTKLEPVPRLYANQRAEDETPEEYGARITDDIAQTPEKYFVRVQIVRLEADDDAHMRDVREAARAIDHAARFDEFYRAPGACKRYGRLCSYHDVCAGIASIDDEDRFVTKRAAHEELTDE